MISLIMSPLCDVFDVAFAKQVSMFAITIDICQEQTFTSF